VTAQLSEVAHVAELVAEKAEHAIRGAWIEQLDWYRGLEAIALADVDGDSVRSAFERVKEAADRAGLAYSTMRGGDFSEQVQAFNANDFDDARTQVRDHAASDETPPASFIASPTRMATIHDWHSLVGAFEAFERELRASLDVTTSKDGLLGSIERRKEEVSAGIERTATALRDLERFG
jgi:hypothetical protein